MSPEFAIEFVRRGILLAIVVAGPLLVVSLLVGVTVSLIQAVTQIQEQTLTFIPKVLALGAMFMLLLPWMINHLIAFLVGSFSSMGTMGH